MKKLSLNKETIASLNSRQMSSFNGGVTVDLTTEYSKCDTMCPTECYQTWCNSCSPTYCETECGPICPDTLDCLTHRCN